MPTCSVILTYPSVTLWVPICECLILVVCFYLSYSINLFIVKILSCSEYLIKSKYLSILWLIIMIEDPTEMTPG